MIDHHVFVGNRILSMGIFTPGHQFAATREIDHIDVSKLAVLKSLMRIASIKEWKNKNNKE